MKKLNDNQFIAELAKKGVKLGDCGRMCSECAFKENSAANLEENNVEKAVGLLEQIAYNENQNVQFNCHEPGTYINANVPCKGFLYAKQYLLKNK